MTTQPLQEVMCSVCNHGASFHYYHRFKCAGYECTCKCSQNEVLQAHEITQLKAKLVESVSKTDILVIIDKLHDREISTEHRMGIDDVLHALLPTKQQPMKTVEEILEYVKEQASLEDRSFKMWVKSNPGCEQQHYRSGMWYAYRQVELFIGKQKSTLLILFIVASIFTGCSIPGIDHPTKVKPYAFLITK